MANLKDLLVSGAAKLLSTLRVSGDTHIDGTLYLNGPIGSTNRMVYVDNTGKFVAGKDLSAVTNYDSSIAIKQIARTANATTYTLTTVAGAVSTVATPIAAGTAGRLAYYTDAYNVGQSTISWSNAVLTVPGSITPGTTNSYTLGTSSLRWSKVYIGNADTYGSAYVPIWWNSGKPEAVTDNKALVNLGAHTATDVDTYASSVWREKPRPGVYGILPTAGGGTGNNTWTANRLVYSNTATKLASTSIVSDGNYLSAVTYLTIGAAHQTTNRLQVGGQTWIQGPLRIGNADVAKNGDVTNNGFGVPNVGKTNYIVFYGVNGDSPGGFQQTYIGERIYQAPSLTSGELSELLIFHGNDAGAVNTTVNSATASASGPDRIRLLAPQVQIDVSTSSIAGTWDVVGQATNREVGFVVHQADGIFLGNSLAKVNGVNRTTIYGHVMIDTALNTSNLYSEGLRINRGSNGWSLVALGGNTGTYEGTSARVWLIGAYSADTGSSTVSDFYIRRNGSNGTTAPGINGGTNGFSVYNRLFVNEAQNTTYNFGVTGPSRFYNGLVYIDRVADQTAVEGGTDASTAQIVFRVTTSGGSAATSFIKAAQTPTNTNYNQSLIIQSGGTMFIGGGESANTVWLASNTGAGTENLCLCADEDIIFYPAAENSNTPRYSARMNSSTFMPANNNRLNLGTNTIAWRYIYSNGLIANRDGSNSAGGISLWSDENQITNYGIAMRSSSAHGWITAANSDANIARANGMAAADVTGLDWGIKFYNAGSKRRGWLWLHANNIVASLNGYGYMQVNRLGLNRVSGTANGRIYWYSPTFYTWVTYMSNPADGQAPHGGRPSVLGSVNSWAMRSFIENQVGYGWIWEAATNATVAAATTPNPLMALNSNDGTLFLNGDMIISCTSGETNRSLMFGYQNTTTLTNNNGASWRLVHYASGSANTNYFAIETTGSTTGSNLAWTNTLRIGMNAHEVTFNGTLQPQATNQFDLGTSSLRWRKLYVGTADSYGAYGQPVYWNAGVPVATYPCQYTTWSISASAPTATLTRNGQYFADTYVIALVVTSGESYLNGPITWTSAANTLTLTTSVAPSGTVSGYVITARAHSI